MKLVATLWPWSTLATVLWVCLTWWWIGLVVVVVYVVAWGKASEVVAREHKLKRETTVKVVKEVGMEVFRGLPRRKVGLVIAHPDDEAMFFVPVLAEAQLGFAVDEEGTQVQFHVLCLSTGDVAGRGAVRVRELRKSLERLSVPPERTVVVDDTQLPDSMSADWPAHVVAKHVVDFIKRFDLKEVTTFDQYGVSGHVNHKACFNGVCEALADPTLTHVKGWALESTSILRKFLGVLDIPFTVLLTGDDLERTDAPVPRNDKDDKSNNNNKKKQTMKDFVTALESRQLVFNPKPHLVSECFGEHASQDVWYRRLFIQFSRYSLFNSFQRIPSELRFVADSGSSDKQS